MYAPIGRWGLSAVIQALTGEHRRSAHVARRPTQVSRAALPLTRSAGRGAMVSAARPRDAGVPALSARQPDGRADPGPAPHAAQQEPGGSRRRPAEDHADRDLARRRAHRSSAAQSRERRPALRQGRPTALHLLSRRTARARVQTRHPRRGVRRLLPRHGVRGSRSHAPRRSRDPALAGARDPHRDRRRSDLADHLSLQPARSLRRPPKASRS